jgi:predicted phosphohydrolase
MISFQISSDLHIEYNEKKPNPFDYITPSADILILAGDIGSLYKIDQLTSFLDTLSKVFKIILYVPGNHEYYTMKKYENESMVILEKRLHGLQKVIKNLYVLNNSSVKINDICILGCTLWSNPTITIPNFIVKIFGMTTKIYKNKHNKDVKYIKNMIEYCKKKKLKLLVVTHYPPTRKVIKYRLINKDKYLSLYVNDLDHLLDKKNVHTWVSGHIHQNYDFKTENGCRVIGNQKGKIKEKILDYKKNLIIKV